jgi:protein-S-isoprenylcysteine O-methyltransferase Ste14
MILVAALCGAVVGVLSVRFGAHTTARLPSFVLGEISRYAYWRKIRLEEANLRIAFGAEYDAYRGNTWALIPKLF